MSQTVVDSTTDHSDPSCCSPIDYRARLVALIAELLDESVDEIASLDDDEDLLSCGLDSIRLMYLQTRVNRLGHALTFDALARTPTLGAWTALLANAPRVARAGAVGAAEAVDVHAPFELSAVQQAYWLGRGDGEVLGNVSCHAFLEFRSRAIDPVRLDTACRRVRERHPMLRTRFEGGRQQILAESDAPVFAHADWRDRTAADAEAEWASLRAFRSHECLDVEHAQVFMMGLVQMPGGEDRVWLSVDLLAADVDSVRLLMQEIGVAYAEPPALPDAPSTWFPAWLARRAAETRDARAAARDAWQA
ncbi:non-ribosomal peptide synthetase, partial [Burkholderia cenocepacia]